MSWTYEKRILIPIDGAEMPLFTKSGTKVAVEYNRIVIGGRGPYIEFTDEQIIQESLLIPSSQEYRLTDTRTYYNEYRTDDIDNVKIYHQKKTVAYADYIIGMWYISPFDLKTETLDEIVTPLPKKEK